MIDPLFRYAETAPNRLALWTSEQTYSYAELSAWSGDLQRQFEDIGVETGTRIGVHGPRDARTVALFWALWRLAAVVVPVSTRLPPSEVLQRAECVGCRLLVTADSSVAGRATDVRIVDATTLVGSGRPGTECSSPSNPFLDNQPATIVYTSGSTGTPKAVLHSWGNHRHSAKGSNANLPLSAADRWMLSLPLYHVGGIAILVRCAFVGAAVAIPPESPTLAEGLRATTATHVSCVATQLRRILDASEDGDFGWLRAVLVGGGPIADAVLKRATARNWPVYTSYGSTEMASQITTTRPGAAAADHRTAGRCLPHRRLRTEEGEIYVRGPTLCEGYVTENGLNDPRTEDGWFATGDRGSIDAEGRLRVLGRTDRMFVSGGENIQPEEIESALERLDAVERAAVVPISDDEYGARPVAFVERTGAKEGESLEAALRRRLPGFKVPDAFHSLPREAPSEGLKIDYQRLRQWARRLHNADPDRS